MQSDDEVCLCFHVTRRKLENWIRLNRPGKASQLSECLGAGTGCGWCRPFLNALFEASQSAAADAALARLNDITPEDYAKLRASYRK